VQSNWIGTDPSGTQPLGNQGNGVLISNAAGNLIGGSAPFNIIAFNRGSGVAVTGTTATSDSILENSIFANGALGIDLGSDGVTPDDSAGHTGPNDFQDFPVLSAATGDAAGTTVSGTLNSTPNATFDL